MTAHVAFLVFPETSASVVYGMIDLVASAGRDWGVIVDGVAGPQLLSPLLVAREAGTVVVGNDVPIVAGVSLADCPPVEVICVPEVNLPPGTPLADRFAPEIAWLRGRFESGATLATACSGAMLLAEAGLLTDCEATTHWAWCDVLARDYPGVKVRGQRALVVAGEGGRLVMAGGGSTWLDLALYLIARLAGVEAAMQVARLNLIDWHSVGQQPFARLARTRQVDDAEIARCQTWIADHYMEPAPVAAMVKLSGLAERTFKRRFQQATGMTPLDYVHTLRIEEAKQMLEAGDAPVEAIAQEVGYEDAAFFGRLFRRAVQLTPSQYRRRFQTMRRALG
ncbi:MAG: helix-turn-helix domain-containing protein [Thiobacillus sp.]|uniref:GlxA family transcriptional regulator n=1 Tax=Thiobacillus sp. TaxID=924 RepID=UPI00273299A4|nr:helix-turn-helix domain-containing protein [Thiobacillus sp.]MDP3586041.1 helix-turn-helix domain-containing protein [Thiobacillus sp.]